MKCFERGGSADIWRRYEAKHCSSLCSQSEGVDSLGDLRGAGPNVFRYVFVALTLRAK